MWWEQYVFYVEKIGSRYFMVAGIFFLLFYVLRIRKSRFKKIQTLTPKQSDYVREVGYSMITIAIFGLVVLVMLQVPLIRQYTTFYTKIEQHGWWYFFLAFPLLFLIHDTYFYWTHRLMHHKRLFKTFHLVHHQSTNPSPWAAYAFHPLEAVVEAGVFVVFLFTLPVHGLHIAIFFFFMIVYNVYGHLGYELYPNRFNKHWLGRWINTSVSHNLHHQYFKGNYGLYFTFWDRVMGTLRKDYDARFDEVTKKNKVE